MHIAKMSGRIKRRTPQSKLGDDAKNLLKGRTLSVWEGMKLSVVRMGGEIVVCVDAFE